MTVVPDYLVRYRKRQYLFTWIFALTALLNLGVSALNFFGPIWVFGFFNLLVGLWCVWESYDSYVKSARGRMTTRNAKIIREGISDARVARIALRHGLFKEYHLFTQSVEAVTRAEKDIYTRAWEYTWNRIR